MAFLENELAASEYGYNFRSVYAYPDWVVAAIRSNGNTKGLKGLPVNSRVLLIDADTDDDATQSERILREIGCTFRVFDTGNRGLHFHVPIEKMEGIDVIHSQVTWMKEKGLWEFADTSIYREGGMYRLEGATHRKTGKKKRLIRSNMTDHTLKIPTVKTPPAVRIKATRSVVPEDIPKERHDYFMNLTQRRDEGGRHLHFFILWQQGLRSGLDEDDVADDIIWYNENYCYPPHFIDDVWRKIESFKQ